LNGVAEPSAPESSEKQSSAKVRASIKPDGLISFIDGKRYAILKRHLATHGLTPAEYRERFGLPGDYPMVAPSYAAKRSELAKSMGLGKSAAGSRRSRR
jgi:predicted transcriptional regulator